MNRYDSDLDGKLSFWEISNALLPYDLRMRDDLEKKCQIFDMSPETKKMIQITLRKVIDNECRMENIRNRLKITLKMTLRTAFEQIDASGRGYINKTDVRRIIKLYSDSLSEATVS